ncbi:hypothetical protein CBM2589_B230144 [Cupriavidus taiwanensis]|uniref:Uncharacterized protein n=1 Tax=Cupriavidus taiwanensis TaxID=164546 RepID=A0A975X045_9BURK|nr:hypothetical protein CBM2589_B230144 [Cupriavidus taiwanensis]
MRPPRRNPWFLNKKPKKENLKTLT